MEKKTMSKRKITNLDAVTVGKEQKTIFVQYSKEKMKVAKDQFYEKSLEIAGEELEFSRVKKEWKEKLKTLNEEKISMMSDISQGGEYRMEDLHLVPDYDAYIMERYTSDGKFYDERKMTPEERQLTANYVLHLHGEEKTGTDNN